MARKQLTLSCLIVGLCFVFSGSLLGDTNNPPPKTDEVKPKSSLDQELLEGLKDDLLDDLPEKPAQKPAPSPKEEKPAGDQPAGKDTSDKPSKPLDDLDRELLQGLEGEDLGAPEDPLVRIGQRMRQAGDRIAKAKTGEETQELQRRVLEDLEELIKLARKRQCQQSSGGSGQSQGTRQMVKQSQPGSAGGGQTPQQGPARDSTDRLRPSELRRPDMAQMNDLIKDIWGHLPDKELREQMLQNSVDQFLPKYELLIEEYFKALAERQQEQDRK